MSLLEKVQKDPKQDIQQSQTEKFEWSQSYKAIVLNKEKQLKFLQILSYWLLRESQTSKVSDQDLRTCGRKLQGNMGVRRFRTIANRNVVIPRIRKLSRKLQESQKSPHAGALGKGFHYVRQQAKDFPQTITYLGDRGVLMCLKCTLIRFPRIHDKNLREWEHSKWKLWQNIEES